MCCKVNVMLYDGMYPPLQQPAYGDVCVTGESKGQGAGGVTSLQKQNPQTSKVLKLVDAAVVAKTLRRDIVHFSSQSRFPLRRLGRYGRGRKEDGKKGWSEVGSGGVLKKRPV